MVKQIYQRPLLQCLAISLVVLIGCTEKQVPDANSSVQEVSKAESSVRFVDATRELGFQQRYDNGEDAGVHAILETIGGGIAVADYDQDGFDDLLMALGGRLDNQQVTGLGIDLWRNHSGEKFGNVSDYAIVNPNAGYTHGLQATDFNSDGFPDFIVTGYYSLKVLINQGDGTFQSGTEEFGIKSPPWGTSCAAGDFDGDGDTDVYSACYVNWSFENNPPCKSSGVPDVCAPGMFESLDDVVYVNSGDGQFQMKSSELGLVSGGKGLGVLATDFNHDAKIDLYVANDTTNNFFYENTGTEFQEIGLASGTAVNDMGVPEGSMGLCELDFDQDLLPDIFVSNYENQAFALYKNDGDCNFRYATTPTGLMALGTTFVAWGSAAVDFDLDGDQDVVISNGHVMTGSEPAQLPILLENNNGSKFSMLKFDPSNYFSNKWRGRGLVAFDYDNDGDLDLCITHVKQDAVILRNETKTDGQWWMVRLVGTRSNRDCIGARIIVKTKKRQILREVVGGGSYLSQNPYYVHWAVPTDEAVEEIQLVWPSGVSERIDTISPFQPIVIVEPANEVAE